MEDRYLLWVIFFLIYHHTLSTGFISGEYEGRYRISSSGCAAIKNFSAFAWWKLTLSTYTIIFFTPLYVFKIAFKCFLKVSVFPFGANPATICPVRGFILPKPVTRSFLDCLHETVGCSPTGAQVEERVAVLLSENSSSNNTTVSSFLTQ